MKVFPHKWLKILGRSQIFIWTFVFTLLSFFIARATYFNENPLFSILFFGETLVASVVFLIVYFFGEKFVQYIGAWIEFVVAGAVTRVLSDFWQIQTQRIVDAVRHENRHEYETQLKEKLQDVPQCDAVVLDTSVIIDGRILGIIKTGFLDAMVVVTQNVIDELQHMADKSNAIKRKKGRRGLDTLKEIRKTCGKRKFQIIDLKTAPEEVDGSLVKYCKANGAKLATIDFNLNKAAQVAGIKILNVNKLANEIKLNILPGETMKLKLIQAGKEEDQALSYLEDGTMVVVKNASDKIGENINVTVEKVIQTDAGKMIFALADQ